MNATRQWITAKDELVCDECGPLHKMEVPIGEPFEVNGKKIWAPSLHPNCRCEVKLKAHLGQEAISHVSRMLTDTRQWTSADDSVDRVGGQGRQRLGDPAQGRVWSLRCPPPHEDT